MYELYADSDITKYMENLFEDVEQEREYMKNYYEQIYLFFGYGMWLITLKDGTVIGRAGIENNEKGEQVLGYMLGKEYQKQGYALEACRAILDYAKKELEITEVVAYIEPENEPSLALARKLGVKVCLL